MKTLHSIKIELNKTILNPGFLLCILITLALQFTNQVYVDVETGKTYCVLEALLQLDRNIIKSDIGLSAFSILQAGVGGYFVMFIPIIAAFPFIPNFCAERNSGLIRFTIQRTGKVRYYGVKFLSAVLGGGLAVLAGYIIFSGIVTILFPSILSYDLSVEEMAVFTTGYMIKRVSLIFLGVFLYGAVSAVPAFMFSSFVKNRYIITCVPFMILYLYSNTLTKFIYDATAKNQQRLINLGNALKPEQITTLYYGDSISRFSLCINLGFVVAAFFLFVIIMNGRRDLGE